MANLNDLLSVLYSLNPEQTTKTKGDKPAVAVHQHRSINFRNADTKEHTSQSETVLNNLPIRYDTGTAQSNIGNAHNVGSFLKALLLYLLLYLCCFYPTCCHSTILCQLTWFNGAISVCMCVIFFSYVRFSFPNNCTRPRYTAWHATYCAVVACGG